MTAAPIKTKASTAAVGKAEAETQAKQAQVKDLKNVNPGEKLKKKDVNNDLSNFMSVFPTI